MMVDHTAEIVTLRQQLAAAEARTRSRHNATAADKGNIKLLTYKAKSTPTLDEAKAIPTLDDLSERMAALLHDITLCVTAWLHFCAVFKQLRRRLAQDLGETRPISSPSLFLSPWLRRRPAPRPVVQKGWIDQRLRFGWFLNFPTMVGNPGTPRTAAWKGFPLR
jgi:hypothetical protein